MNQALKKFISVFLLAIFLLGAGAGQIIHEVFHKHPSFESQQTSLVLGAQHSYCSALQLILPEFSETGNLFISSGINLINQVFAAPKIFTPQFYSFRPSGRAPPVLA